MTNREIKVVSLWLLIYCILSLGSATDDPEAGKSQMKWFPTYPGGVDKYMGNAEDETQQQGAVSVDKHGRVLMGVKNEKCDDAKANLQIDFDPYNITHTTKYMCLEDKRDYRGNYTVEPIIREYIVPSAYVALHRCMNQSISYKDNIPTFGTHRPLWPKYGEYEYVPVQRWLHNCEHGAIVMLYHPCANQHQTAKIKKLVKSCLYRHIITPYNNLTAARPFALVAWGRSVEFSSFDQNVIQDFIQQNALHGPEEISRNGQYGHKLVDPAVVVSDIDDETLCPK